MSKVTGFAILPTHAVGDGEFEVCKAAEASHWSIYMVHDGSEDEPVGDYEIETHWGDSAATKAAAVKQAETLAAQYGVEVTGK